MKLNGIKMTVKRGLMVLQKHLPEIMCVGGTIGTIAGTVMACHATTKLDATLNKMEQLKADLEARREEMDEHEYKRELTKVYIKNGFELIKLYGPSALTLIGSLAMLNGSSIVLKRRNASLAAAYAVLRESYNQYKKKMIAAGADEPMITDSDAPLKVNAEGNTPKPGDVKTFWFMYDAANSEDYTDAYGVNFQILSEKEKFLSKRLRNSDQRIITLNDILDYLNFRIKKFQDGDNWCVTYDPSPENSVYYDRLVDLGFHDNYMFTHGYENCTELKITCVYKPEGLPQLIEA